MSAAEYCDFSGLPKDSCGHCRSKSRVLPDTMFQANEGDGTHAARTWITAQYPGRCVRCRHQIVPGDRIGAEGDQGWICEDCGL
jgi:hypothetical protein